MQSDAPTPAAYLASLPEDRRRALSKVRTVIRRNLPTGMVEAMNWGMISYEVPLRLCPQTYNGQPLSYAGLASQKQHMSLYLMGLYADDSLRARFEKDYVATGRRLDAGKACIRFRSIDDLPLELVAEAVSAMTTDAFIALHEAAASLRASRRR